MIAMLLATLVGLLLAPPPVVQELLPDTGVIAGTLTAKDGTPLAAIRVTARSISETPDPSEPVVLVSLAQTDALGHYRLEGIPAGEYYVAAGFLTTPVFYPGVEKESEAVLVSVSAGETVPDVNFSVLPPTVFGATVSGRVVIVPGSTFRRDRLGRQQPMQLILSGSAVSPLSVQVRADGTFEFSKVPPGSYMLRARSTAGGVLRLTVTDHDVNDLEFRVPFVTVAEGEVVMEDGSALPSNSPLFFTVRSENRQFASSVSVKGLFTAELIEGDNQITLNGLPLGYAIKSISYEGHVVGSGPLRIGQTPASGPIRITLSVTPFDRLFAFRVTGKAINIPAEFFDVGPTLLRLSAEGAPVLETPVQTDGTFEFPKVPPGTYSAYITSYGRPLFVPDVVVQDKDVEVGIDLQDNPFPGFPGASLSAAFDFSRTIVVEGTISQSITGMGPEGRAPARYFRIEVKNPPSGSSPIRWAVLMIAPTAVPANPETAKLSVGTHVQVVLNPDRDGRPRGALVGQSGEYTAFGVRILKD